MISEYILRAIQVLLVSPRKKKHSISPPEGAGMNLKILSNLPILHVKPANKGKSSDKKRCQNFIRFGKNHDYDAPKFTINRKKHGVYFAS